LKSNEKYSFTVNSDNELDENQVILKGLSDNKFITEEDKYLVSSVSLVANRFPVAKSGYSGL